MAELSLYWWSPLREPRQLAWQLRAHRRAWVTMRFWGGSPFKNFGDELSPLIVGHILGRRARWRQPSEAEFFGIGSILEHYISSGSQSIIWGSGLRTPNQIGRDRIDPTKILAVRGHLTRKALNLPDSTVLGDPGLIVREIFEPNVRRSGTLVLPHFMAFGNRRIVASLKTAQSGGSRVLSPSLDPHTVVRAIGDAELLLTSSLHGKVVADAMGTPAVLVRFGETEEPTHKFEDYLSVWGLEPRFYEFNLLAERQPEAVRERALYESSWIESRLETVTSRLRGALRG